MSTPNHYQRQFMQRLRNAGWVQATALPDSPKVIAKLLSKGWIEKVADPEWSGLSPNRYWIAGKDGAPQGYNQIILQTGRRAERKR